MPTVTSIVLQSFTAQYLNGGDNFEAEGKTRQFTVA